MVLKGKDEIVAMVKFSSTVYQVRLVSCCLFFFSIFLFKIRVQVDAMM